MGGDEDGHRHADRFSACLILTYRKDSLVSKGKGKVHPITGHEVPEWEQRYSSILSLTSALDWVGVQRHSPAALPPGKTWYPLYKKLGGPRDGLDKFRKSRLQRDSIHGPISP
jgi:hypothetical protein